jgi:hypothetical protein
LKIIHLSTGGIDLEQARKWVNESYECDVVERKTSQATTMAADDFMSAEEMIARHKIPSPNYRRDYFIRIFIL